MIFRWPVRMPKLLRYRRYRIGQRDYILVEKIDHGHDIVIRLTPYSQYLKDRRL